MTLRHSLRTTLAAGVVAAAVVPVWAGPAVADHDAPCSVGEVPGSERLADAHGRTTRPSTGCTCSRPRRSRRAGA